MLAVQAAPVDTTANVARSVSAIESRAEVGIVARDTGYDAEGNEIDANGNLIERGE